MKKNKLFFYIGEEMVNEYSKESSGNELLYRVYGWMTIGLALTAGVAYYVANTPQIASAIIKNSGMLIVLMLLELGLVFALSFFINKMSGFVAALTFLLYSVLNGVTMSFVFLIYTNTSIATTFFVTAGMFAAMAIYGYFTKADLSGMGNFLFMGLIGLILALVVNIFLKSSTFDYIISACGVLIFSLLTAYDVQQIKLMSNSLMAQGEGLLKISILGALKLYLDFINLFLYLLRFMGQQKSE